MSTQAIDAPQHDEHPRMMLILGKPGGGKGTISEKILTVRIVDLLSRTALPLPKIYVQLTSSLSMFS